MSGRKKPLLGTISRFLKSNSFFCLLVLFFAIMSVFFALSINYGIPSDERYHFRFIEFYANRPILDGPVIVDQGVNYFDLQDIQRIPSYLYHYVFGFVLSGLRLVSDSLFFQITALRFFNIIIGVFAIFQIKSLFRQLKATNLLTNLTICSLILTGMFSWTVASISYDPVAILMFVGLMRFCVDIIKNGIRLKQLIALTTISMALVLTKVSLSPFIAVALLVAAVLALTNRENKPLIENNLYFKKPINVLLTVAFILFSLLSVERLGLNIVRYGSIQPTCDKLHTTQQCLEDDVFSRNYIQKNIYAEQKMNGESVNISPISYTTNWVKSMYERLAFYYGHEQMRANTGAVVVFWVSASFVFVSWLVARKKIKLSKEEIFLALVLFGYIVILFMFNLRTLIRLGQPYALQGRYLLPILPILYYMVIKILLSASSTLEGGKRVLYGVTLTALVITNLYMHFPLLVFYRGTEAKWYTEQSSALHLTVQDGLKKINIKTII